MFVAEVRSIHFNHVVIMIWLGVLFNVNKTSRLIAVDSFHEICCEDFFRARASYSMITPMKAL